MPRGCATDVLDASTEVHIYLKGVVDFGGEIKRLQKERGLVAGRLDKLVKKTEAKDYATKCPAATQEEDRTKVAEMNGEIASLDAAIAASRRAPTRRGEGDSYSMARIRCSHSHPPRRDGHHFARRASRPAAYRAIHARRARSSSRRTPTRLRLPSPPSRRITMTR